MRGNKMTKILWKIVLRNQSTNLKFKKGMIKTDVSFSIIGVPLFKNWELERSSAKTFRKITEEAQFC